jgi:hypothetical protein
MKRHIIPEELEEPEHRRDDKHKQVDQQKYRSEVLRCGGDRLIACLVDDFGPAWTIAMTKVTRRLCMSVDYWTCTSNPLTKTISTMNR